MTNGFDKTIHLTNLNIRQSISLLLTRLILLDIAAAGLVLLFYFFLENIRQLLELGNYSTLILFSVFSSLGILKIITTSYIILRWLNEYYEITPDFIIHKKGIIFKSEQKYKLDNVRRINIIQDFLGEIFNYGTITLYDMRLQKYFDMYLIHNPKRYIHVIETLKPMIESNVETTIVPFIPVSRESTSY